MLEAVNVVKRYDGKTVLDGFSHRFAQGGRYCLMGPSGCGKTTLLRLLMGLIKPDGGEIRGLHGLRLSAVFQEDRLVKQLTALANVRLASRAEAPAVTAMLMALGLDESDLCEPVETFSGGMKRRVALCRALLADYDALFLDEPYKGLDQETRDNVMALVRQSTQGKTVIMVTHDPLEADGYEIIPMGSEPPPQWAASDQQQGGSQQ